MARHKMSMESALDEERRNVLALLEGVPHSANRGPTGSLGMGGRASSPYMSSNTPRSPVRSMLDIWEEPGPRRGASVGTNDGLASPVRGPYRSMLDIDSPPPKESRSAQTSPTELSHGILGASSNAMHPRSLSDAALRPAKFGPRSLPERKANPVSDYQFSGFLTNNPGAPYTPKRNTLGGKKNLGSSDAMKGDLSAYGSKDRGRNHSTATTGISIGVSGKSRSPHHRLGPRSNSPHSSLLNANSLGIVHIPGKFTLDSGVQVDMNNAYRRLSDANLALAGGSLAILSTKGRRQRADSQDTTSPEGGRLEKDWYPEDGSMAESSEEDNPHSSDDEEAHRGRKQGGRAIPTSNGLWSSTIGTGLAQGPRVVLSLLAAAEEERQEIASKEEKKQYKVRSLLDPEITVTGPGGDRMKPSKPAVHPTNAFDQGGTSGINTPIDSDTEADISDIRRAQRLAVIMTPVASYPEVSRSVRTLYRGDFTKMQQEALDDQRRVRKYLVATDLSDEATHALEWTVGTVLRDGDTLLAIYCVDEETGIRPEAAVVEDQVTTNQAATIAAMTNNPQPLSVPGATSIGSSPLGGSQSAANSPTGRERSRVEQERYKAVEDITERVTRLLRKTRLQVRVVVEVIHCKSPKHLITEVIDFISPTLVILGSRGRSALKGVILGSFSNYLVTKSSVPVMVARKKLRKHSKYKRPSVKLANNLLDGVSGRSLSAAKVDELITR